jgi:hypothetical protein
MKIQRSMQFINKAVNPFQLQLRKAKHNLHAIHGFSALVTTSSTRLSSRPFSLSLSPSPSPSKPSSAHRLQEHANRHPLASSVRRRRRATSSVSPECCDTSTYATEISSPFLSARVAVRCSCAVPVGKTGLAEGAQLCEICGSMQ